MSWIGAAISGLGSLVGAASSNANINKQIKAQQEENEKNRVYNLMLAQQQNKWNVEQWERENDYNTPSAQMSRLKAAGINPHLAYSNGVSNISAASPGMTSGAPSAPVDMSALGQKATLGQAIQMALSNEAARAVIDNTKANTRKTLADAGISETQAKYEDVKQQLNVDMSRTTYSKLKEELEIARNNVQESSYKVEAANYEQLSRRLEWLYKEREMSAIIKKLENEANISENEAKFAIESYMYRLMGVQASGELAKFESSLPRQLREKFADDADTISLILQGVNFLLGNADNISKLKVKK